MGLETCFIEMAEDDSPAFVSMTWRSRSMIGCLNIWQFSQMTWMHGLLIPKESSEFVNCELCGWIGKDGHDAQENDIEYIMGSQKSRNEHID